MSDVINVIAKLHILPADKGGKRKTGIKSGYRPNHVFNPVVNGEFNTFIGEITFSDREFIYPGDEYVVDVKFINTNEIEEFIRVGKTWWIYEVPNLIAEAVILKVL